MRIFILEDNTERHKKFKEMLIGHEYIITETAKEAIQILNQNLGFDYYFLDHDLGDEIFVDSSHENTGAMVAKYLSDKEIKGKIIIHSMNPIGAKVMLGYLPQAEWIPFSVQSFKGV